MSYPSIAKSFQPFPSAMVQDQLATQGRLWPRRTRSSVPERWNHQNWRDGACFGHFQPCVCGKLARSFDDVSRIPTASPSQLEMGAGAAIPQREETGFLSLLSSQVLSLCNLPSEIHQSDHTLLYLKKTMSESCWSNQFIFPILAPTPSWHNGVWNVARKKLLINHGFNSLLNCWSIFGKPKLLNRALHHM